jgi:RHS repeat-associated protein
MATPTVNTEYTYEPYGKPTTTGSATTNPFAFTGLVWDPGSGLYDNRHRQLNPSIAQFAAEDPIDILGGWNLYRYAQASPTSRTDPLGLSDCIPEPGYHDTNASLGYVDLGLIKDSCGFHPYAGVGYGYGFSQTYSNGTPSCISSSATLILPVYGTAGFGGSVGFGTDANLDNGSGFFEFGPGSVGAGAFANILLDCPFESDV